MFSSHKFCFCLLLLLNAVFPAVVGSSLNLRMLHVLFRHGEKVPHREYQNYPNDPYGNHSYFPYGNGDLTNQGKMREYEIGRLLRDAYDRYFGQQYNPELIYARSTDVPRTQMSLQLVLAGLFPPSAQQTWNPQLPWNPVSLFFRPSEEDALLFPHLCPRYVAEYSRFLRQAHVKAIVGKYRDAMAYLTEHTGKVVDNTKAVYYLYNLFKEEAAQNLTLPKWTNLVYPNPMKEITALDFSLRSYTPTLKRLNGGLLLRKIVEDIRTVQAGTLEPPERKAFFFSAHELNVAALTRALGTDDPVLPAYGSTVIVETLQDQNLQYFVKVLLWSGVSGNLSTQVIPGCDEVCPFDRFLELLRDVIPSEEEYDCYGLEGTRGRGEAAGAAPRMDDGGHLPLVLLLAVSFRYL